MIFCQEVTNRVSDADRKLVCRISELLWKANDAVKKRPKLEQASFECHSICRALCLTINDGSIRYVDGDYIGIEISEDLQSKLHGCTHSWLVTKDETILDPYPVGMFSIAPILLVTEGTYKPFAAGRYREDAQAKERFSLPLTWRKARVLHKCFS